MNMGAYTFKIQRRFSKLESSVDNLRGIIVFGKLQHSKYTDGPVPMQSLSIIQNCLAVSLIGKWLLRHPVSVRDMTIQPCEIVPINRTTDSGQVRAMVAV